MIKGREPVPPEKFERGMLGPIVLTVYAKLNGLHSEAQPQDVFYPLHWREAASLFDPTARIEHKITENTRAVHLWNWCIKDMKRVPPPHNSFVQRMCEKHNVT
jgi:hypothetical protein